MNESTRARLGAVPITVVVALTVAAAGSHRKPPERQRSVDEWSHGIRAHIVRSADSVDRLAVDAVVYNGWKMFEVYCTRCHGEDAVGSSFAPALIRSVGPDGTISHRAFFETVTHGRPTKGMPTWGNVLSPEQKEDVWYYLRARAVGGLAPGRPHIKTGASRDSTALPKSMGDDTTWAGPPTNS